jgi:small subunit ribosomal protein S18
VQGVIPKQAKKCYFCQKNSNPDWKEKDVLLKFISERGRIFPRSRTFLCSKHQRKLSKAVKRARYLSLLPFVSGIK